MNLVLPFLLVSKMATCLGSSMPQKIIYNKTLFFKPLKFVTHFGGGGSHKDNLSFLHRRNIADFFSPNMAHIYQRQFFTSQKELSIFGTRKLIFAKMCPPVLQYVHSCFHPKKWPKLNYRMNLTRFVVYFVYFMNSRVNFFKKLTATTTFGTRDD
jgi:hypothetical protein